MPDDQHNVKRSKAEIECTMKIKTGSPPPIQSKSKSRARKRSADSAKAPEKADGSTPQRGTSLENPGRLWRLSLESDHHGRTGACVSV